MCPIVVSALAPCQWRSPDLMCTTSPTLISRFSCYGRFDRIHAQQAANKESGPHRTAAFAATQSSAPASAFSVSQAGGLEQVSASYAYNFVFLPWTITLQSSASYPSNPPSS